MLIAGYIYLFIKLAAVRHLSKLYALTLHYYYLKQSESYHFKVKEGRLQSRIL